MAVTPARNKHAGHCSTISPDNLSLALESSRQIAYDWQIATDELHFSGDFAENLAGIPLDAGNTWRSTAVAALLHPDDREHFRNRLHCALKGNGNGESTFYQIEIRLLDAVLGWHWVEIRGTVVERTTDGRALRMVGTFSDIEERKRSEERIRRLAYYDGLTSLPNRFLFREYLDLALKSAKRHGTSFAVLFLDLDSFKEVNDTLGHTAGDQVLQEVAGRLRGTLRSTDKIARMGGDEFYVLIEETSERAGVGEVAQKLLDAAAAPVIVGGTTCSLSASIGISFFPWDGGDAQTLLRHADDAMYRAKNRGKNGYCFHLSPLSPVSEATAHGHDSPAGNGQTAQRRA